jgi:hypothetical protein
MAQVSTMKKDGLDKVNEAISKRVFGKANAARRRHHATSQERWWGQLLWAEARALVLLFLVLLLAVVHGLVAGFKAGFRVGGKLLQEATGEPERLVLGGPRER